MKTTLMLLAGCAALLAVLGVPAGWDRPAASDAESSSEIEGRLLAVNVQSSNPCHLVVASDAQTIVDRGGVSTLDEPHEFTGTFRYWEEPVGRVLYVYDDTQSLVGRVINPESVTLLDQVE